MINILEKYEFSQEDYLMYEFHFVNEKENQLAGTVCKVRTQKHDKTFKEVLKDKEEMSKFLKEFIELEVDTSKLQLYNSEFINSKYEKRISDIIYKEKEKEIHYLIEHQSKVDVNMPHRILEYCMELMREVKKNQNLKKGRNPLIVPIVIYTGTSKWNVSENFSDTQKVEERYKKYAIDLKYKLIDINKYGKEELTNKNTKMTSMMLLERCKNDEELKKVIIELYRNANMERREWIENLIKYVFPGVLNDGEILKLIKRREKMPMEDLIERLKANRMREDKALKKKAVREGLREGRAQGIVEGRAKGKKEGIKETIKLIVKNMLKENQDENTIMKFTNANKEEIEEVRRELEASC